MTEDQRKERQEARPSDPRLIPGHCHKCGCPRVDNPHPDAGNPGRYLEVGCTKECLPCTVLSRHQWYQRAVKAEKELRELKEAGLGAPSFPAQTVRLKQTGPGKKITLTLELDAIEPSTSYLVTPLNPAVVREKSAEQLWREAATMLEMANAELSLAYAELKRQLKNKPRNNRNDRR